MCTGRGKPRAVCNLTAFSIPVIKVEDDPDGDPERVYITDQRGNRASMSVMSYRMTCRLAPGAQVVAAALL